MVMEDFRHLILGTSNESDVRLKYRLEFLDERIQDCWICAGDDLELLLSIKTGFNMTNNLFLLSMPGGSEWILIVIAVLVLFGGKKIPEFMKGLGKGMREFNDAKNNVKQEFENGLNEPQKPASVPEAKN
jgi:sec-independent protein translocase protein TatA